MVDTLRESAQWRKGKTPIISKYLADHSELFTEIAGRGFLSLPGYAIDLENNLELTTKLSLSDLNYKILSDTIERELKQSGIDYDLSYKTALMVWELEKQALMAAWEAEYAVIKQGEMTDENTLNLLAIEVSRRAATLLTQKTAIDVEMEGYKQTLATLDGTIAPYDIQLANAKLLTAQKKAELIPIIATIITKEQELLVIEQSKAAEYTAYMTAEQEVITKKQELTPFINDLATETEVYANKIINEQVPIETQIANEEVRQADLEVEKSAYKIQALDIQLDIENKGLDLLESKRTLDTTKFDNDQSLISTEIDLNTTYHNLENSQSDTILQDDRDTTAALLADKTTIHTTNNASRLSSTRTLANSKESTDDRMTRDDVYRLEEVARIEAAAKITAQLEHLIG